MGVTLGSVVDHEKIRGVFRIARRCFFILQHHDLSNRQSLVLTLLNPTLGRGTSRGMQHDDKNSVGIFRPNLPHLVLHPSEMEGDLASGNFGIASFLPLVLPSGNLLHMQRIQTA